jgi:copper resistance protein B
MKRMSRAVILVSALLLSAWWAPSGAAAQEVDNAVFHYSLFEVDASSTPGPTVGRWRGAGWIGTDFDRLWWSTEGERAGGAFGDADAMLLYGKYVRRFWDLVIGYRQDIEPTVQGYLGFGLMGLAPYWFEVSLLGFVSQRGRPSLRFEADTDLFITQRLVLQPSGYVDWLITSDNALDKAPGANTVELGMRIRYEIRRKFAPYLDLTWVKEKGLRTPVPGDPATEGLRLGAGLRLIY